MSSPPSSSRGSSARKTPMSIKRSYSARVQRRVRAGDVVMQGTLRHTAGDVNVSDPGRWSTRGRSRAALGLTVDGAPGRRPAAEAALEMGHARKPHLAQHVRGERRTLAAGTVHDDAFHGIDLARVVVRRRVEPELEHATRYVGRAGNEAELAPLADVADVPARALGQAIGRALESTKPAVDVALENARRVGHESGFAQRLQARVAAALDEHRAAQGLLAVGGDDRRPRDAATIRIAHTPSVLAEQPGQARHSPSRPVGYGIDDHLDTGGRTAGRDGHQAEPEPSAQVAHVAPVDRHAPSAAASRSADREIDAVRPRASTDTLQQEREAEAQLQLDDHG